MPFKTNQYSILFLFIVINFAFAQVDTSWTRRYNGSADSADIPTAFLLDDSGNLYVTGYSQGNGSAYDFLTLKYSPSGQRLWTRRFNGAGNFDDHAYTIAKDDSGYIYVSGLSNNPNHNFLIIKYTLEGETVWTRSPDITWSVSDLPTKLVISHQGDIYMAGTLNRTGTSEDYIVIKYNVDGEFDWLNTYDGNNGIDRVTGLATDDSANVIVTGYSFGSGTGYDFATIKYNSAGDTIWVKRYNGNANNQDYARAIATDNSGNVYVSGEVRNSITRYDYGIIKYAPDGETLWTNTYNGTANNDDFPLAMTIDLSGNAYVCGYSMGSGTYYDYATVKFTSTGEFGWAKRYDGPPNAFDRANAITTDNYGNVYVTGASEGSGSQFDYLTIKYNSNGDTVWQSRFDGGISGVDEANAILLDDEGNVYVGGYSASATSDFDYLTIKYSQPGAIGQNYRKPLPIIFLVSEVVRNTSCIKFNLREKSNLSIKLFSITGQCIKTIIAGEFNPGEYKFSFDVSKISSGVYFCWLSSQKINLVKKITVLQ
jgi:uncharacterized delta-60 repeat protein